MYLVPGTRSQNWFVSQLHMQISSLELYLATVTQMQAKQHRLRNDNRFLLTVVQTGTSIKTKKYPIPDIDSTSPRQDFIRLPFV